MPSITSQQVQKLREKTGVGFMDCKGALENSGGDLEKAIQLLREKGKASAAQKALRSARQGVVCSWASSDFRKGSLIELNCETDFVARTPEFLHFAKKLARQVAERSLNSVESLLSEAWVDSQETVDSVLKEKIALLGENILVKRVASVGDPGTLLGHYIHAPFQDAPDCGALGSLVALKAESDSPEIRNLLKELSMQVAAAHPKWIGRDDIPSDLLNNEMEIYKEQCRQTGKPEKSWDKIVQGKLNDFLKQFCLLEQPYIRDSKTIVQTLVNSAVEKMSAAITIKEFFRFKLGEE